MSSSKVIKKILIGVSTIADPQLTHQKKILRALKKISDIKACSPIYYFKNDEEEGLSAVYMVRTQSSPQEFSKKIKEIVRQTKSPYNRILILTFEDIVLRTPQLVLPSDEMHLFKRWIIPAADVWGDLVHPIIGKELRYLSEATGSDEKIEFFAQSKSLLDFLRADA